MKLIIDHECATLVMINKDDSRISSTLFAFDLLWKLSADEDKIPRRRSRAAEERLRNGAPGWRSETIGARRCS